MGDVSTGAISPAGAELAATSPFRRVAPPSPSGLGLSHMAQPVVLSEAKDLAVVYAKDGGGGGSPETQALPQPPQGPSLRSGRRNPAPAPYAITLPSGGRDS